MKLKNKTVFITGASSGIGAACARVFAAEGSRLILAARRQDRLKELARELYGSESGNVLLMNLDVRYRKSVEKAIKTLPQDWAAIDILINNAGLARGLALLQDGDIEDWEEMIDTNLKGLLYVSRAVIPGMVKRNSGDVINIGSIAGHEVYPQGNVYCATKHGVDALTKGIRMDLLGTNVRVATVDPGLVETEFSEVRFHGDTKRAKSVYEGLSPLTAGDIADAVLYCATRPAHVQVAEIILLPTDQRSATNVWRNS